YAHGGPVLAPVDGARELELLGELRSFLAARRQQYVDRPADDLVALPAVDSLGAVVPGQDRAVAVAADDRVVRRVDDRSQPLSLGELLLQASRALGEHPR